MFSYNDSLIERCMATQKRSTVCTQTHTTHTLIFPNNNNNKSKCSVDSFKMRINNLIDIIFKLCGTGNQLRSLKSVRTHKANTTYFCALFKISCLKELSSQILSKKADPFSNRQKRSNWGEKKKILVDVPLVGFMYHVFIEDSVLESSTDLNLECSCRTAGVSCGTAQS